MKRTYDKKLFESLYDLGRERVEWLLEHPHMTKRLDLSFDYYPPTPRDLIIYLNDVMRYYFVCDYNQNHSYKLYKTMNWEDKLLKHLDKMNGESVLSIRTNLSLVFTFFIENEHYPTDSDELLPFINEYLLKRFGYDMLKNYLESKDKHLKYV